MQTIAVAESFVESSRAPLVFVKNEGVDFFANRLAQDLLKNFHVAEEFTALKEFLGQGNTGMHLDAMYQQTVASKGFVTQEFAVRAVDGSVQKIDILTTLFNAQDEQGVSILLLPHPLSSSGGTDAENELLAQERAAEYADLNSFLSAILDSSTETFIIAVSMNGTILSFNNGACKAFQYSKRDAVARLHVGNLFSSSENEAGVWDKMVIDAFENGKCERTTYLLRQDGTVFPALVDLTPLRNSEDQTLGILFLGRDMTETMKTQLALSDRKLELEFINNVSLEMSETMRVEEVASVALTQLHAKFQGMYSALFLLNREDMTYQAVSKIPALLPDEVQLLMAPSMDDSLLLEAGELLVRGVGRLADTEEYSVPRPTVKLMIPLMYKASLIGVSIILTPLVLNRDTELLRFGTALGATVGSSLENAILLDDSITKSQEIKKQNQELDEFAYVVSHDLKEPLAGISFISNLLVDEYYNAFDETGKTYIASLIDFSKRLGSLIDALLDLSRIGRISNAPERVDLHEVMYNVKQNLAHRLSNDEVHLDVPSRLPYVHGDKTRIEQVLINLVGNAIKFNDNDHPLIEIGFEEESPEFWRFFVKDNGIGIEPEYFEKIFKIFERLQPREEYEGNGAGLTIVKKIIEHHNGRVWLESELNKGTTFYFTLPKFTETT